MPDITMCTGDNCPLKETCYRYRAIPSQRQSMFTEPPVVEDKCNYYWPIESVLKPTPKTEP